MPTFRYVAFDKNGRKKEGVLEAESIGVALGNLKSKGLYPDSIEAISKQKTRFLGSLRKGFSRISQRERADIFFQLATLINTGISLTEALNIVADQLPNKRLKEVILEVKDRVSEGIRFSKALSDFEGIFTRSYIKMIEIAEKTGKLADVLFKISQREEHRSSFNQRIAPVVLYPLFVLLFGFGVVVFLLGYVVPKMEKIFSSFHKELPFVTRLLVSIGLFVNSFLLLVLILSINCLFLLAFLVASSILLIGCC